MRPKLRSTVVVHDQAVTLELDEPDFLQGCGDGAEVLIEQSQERVVGDVPRGDDEQLAGRPSKEVTVAEGPVLGDDETIFGIGERRNVRIGGAVSFW